jgi:hypothetical protein
MVLILIPAWQANYVLASNSMRVKRRAAGKISGPNLQRCGVSCLRLIAHLLLSLRGLRPPFITPP